MRSKSLNGVLREPAKNQWRLDGLEIVGKALGCGGGKSRSGSLGRKPRNRFCLHGDAGRSAIKSADLEHFGNWSNAGDGFFREFSNSESDRACQFPVKIDWAAAHSSDHASVLGLGTAQSHQDNIALGPIGVLQNAKDFNIHGLRLRALKNRVRYAAHSRMNLTNRDGVNSLAYLREGCLAENQEGS